MRIAIVYDSRTGTTRAAAIAMGCQFEEQGHSCQVQSVSEADPTRIVEADMVCVGSWTRGLFFFLQSATPATMRFLESLGDLAGKQALVFATYKISTGSTMYSARSDPRCVHSPVSAARHSDSAISEIDG